MKTKKEKAQFIHKFLNELYPDPAIPLFHLDPFTLLCAVVLSAQCTDKKVNEVTPQLFLLAPTPSKMAELSVETIESIIKPLGLAPTKAKALKNLSIKILQEFEGKIPCCLEALETLPGVGHKTASCVMIQAFNEPAFPVDTHIHRCAKRWGLSKGHSVEQTEKDLKRLFPKNSWAKLHLQIIYFAREHCSAKKHHSKTCPLCSVLEIKT
jgi:endonuclease-3